MSWSDALQFAANDGVAVILAAVVSFLAENWPWYETQPSNVKRLVYAALAFAVPLAAATLGVLSDGWVFSWPVTFWPAIRAGLTALGVGTLVHTRKL